MRSQVWNIVGLMEAANRLIGPSQRDLYCLEEVLTGATSRRDMEHLASWRCREAERLLRKVRDEVTLAPNRIRVDSLRK